MNDHSFVKTSVYLGMCLWKHNTVGGDSKYLIIAMGIKHGAIVKIRINQNSTHIVNDSDTEFINPADCVSF